MKPQLCVLDAVRILTAHGPMGGKLDDVALKMTIAAGTPRRTSPSCRKRARIEGFGLGEGGRETVP